MKQLCMLRLIAAALALALSQTSAAAQATTDQLGAVDTKTRVSAFNSIQTQRKETIHRLMRLVERKQSYELFDTTTLAVQALGQFRASESIDLLVSMITFKPPMPTFELRDPEAAYPAAIALADIGSPALPSLVQLLAESDDAQVRHLAVWVSSQILGKDTARHYLQVNSRALAGQKAKRLEAAIKAL